MNYITLPDTLLRVSSICLGTGSFGSAIARETAWAILDAFVAAGGNFVDTAHIYASWLPNGAGASERTIGEWLARSGLRSRMVIATKGGHPDLKAMRRPRLAPAQIARDLHESLDRLQTDRVELYWLHRDDPAVPVGEILGALNDHLASGLVGAIGASNWTPRRLAEASDYARAHSLTGFCASQIGWSLARISPGAAEAVGTLFMDDATMRFHEQTLMPVIPFSSQAQGFFSGKYDPAGARVAGPRKDGVIRRYGNDANYARLERAARLADRRGRVANDIALAYLLSQRFPVSAIVGPRSVEQIRSSCAAGELRLTADELRFLESGAPLAG